MTWTQRMRHSFGVMSIVIGTITAGGIWGSHDLARRQRSRDQLRIELLEAKEAQLELDLGAEQAETVRTHNGGMLLSIEEQAELADLRARLAQAASTEPSGKHLLGAAGYSARAF